MIGRESKISLRWYRLAKDDGTERYVRSLQGYEGVRLKFRLLMLRTVQQVNFRTRGSVGCVVMTGEWCLTIEKWKIFVIS